MIRYSGRTMPTIAVLGASNNKNKYGYKAVRAYDLAGYTVYPINPKEKEIAGHTSFKSILDIPGTVDVATIYLPPEIGEKVISEVIRKKVKKVFLNPGAESPALLKKLARTKIEVVQACSILDAGFHPEAIDE